MSILNIDYNCVAVIGCQYGDEAKGKCVDEIIKSFEANNENIYCVRFNGGSNAGHSIYIDNVLYDTHILPSGILTQKCTNIIGDGTVINITQFFSELNKLQDKATIHNIKLGNILISDKATLTLFVHKFIDSVEGKQFGSTGSGISQTIADKANRFGIQLYEFQTDKWKEHIIALYDKYKLKYDKQLYNFNYKLKYYENDNEEITFFHIDDMMNWEINYIESKLESLKLFITNTAGLLNNLDLNIPIVFEGANSIMLDPHVGYPNCTATCCTIGGLLSGSGINIKFLTKRNFKIIGVVKGYITRVGTGFLITEDFGTDGQILQSTGNEFGVTTGRIRRTGWFDIPLIKYTNTMIGCDYLNITKLDVMSKFEKVKICIAYKHKITNIIHDKRLFNDNESYNYDPIYEEFDGWKDFDFSKCNVYDDLHPNVKTFIEYIEINTGIQVRYINTGRETGQLIDRNMNSNVN